MPLVLGIDTSLTATGLCQVAFQGLDNSGAPVGLVMRTATVSAPPPAKNGDRSKRAMARRVNRLLEQIGEALDDHRPDLIAMEALAYAAKGEGVWVLPWIWGRVIELCEERDIPLIVVGTSQLKKYVVGKGAGPGTDKDSVMLAVAKRWPQAEVSNNNEADATAVASIGCRYLGYPIEQLPKDHLTIMAKIDS
ncbi:RuvC-like Holliday junction resolvase [Mycobacterium phage CRB2]|uniref:RuvC-like resolvase n=1 Tax=Mycobacterium phage CRB2 TaxID=2483623 RepID=A0A455LLY5_9CAUD|nr:RuvC-like Holliday junction resolvase [Mycobacterium phage CRB2]AYP69995.1 RuvC-like resolvase [Mycobacterium phage CRB2]